MSNLSKMLTLWQYVNTAARAIVFRSLINGFRSRKEGWVKTNKFGMTKLNFK